jgi:hypothetical protein
MRPIRVTLNSQTSSNPIILDTYRNPFNVGIGVTFSTGAALTYTVEYTYDDVFASTYDPNASSSVWFPVTALAAKTASLDGTITSPFTALRFRVSSFTSGSATMTVIQAGMPGL